MAGASQFRLHNNLSMTNELFKVALKLSSHSPFKPHSDQLHLPARALSFSGFDTILANQTGLQIFDLCRNNLQIFRQGKSSSIIMMGPQSKERLVGRSGLIQLSLSYLYQLKHDLRLKISFLQISNEQTFDITQSDGPLPVLQSKNQFYVKGLKQINIGSLEQALAYSSSLYSHAFSSRSHYLLQMSKEEQGRKSVLFNLVELGDAESWGQEDQISHQSRTLKKSLFYFSQVIKQLSEQKSPCYRNCVLTKLLKKTFQNQTQRWLLLTLSNHQKDIDQDIRLLKLGLLAKKAKARETQQIEDIKSIKGQIEKVRERIKQRNYSQQSSLITRLQRQNILLKQKISILEDISFAPYNLNLDSQFLKVLYAEQPLNSESSTQIWEFEDMAENMEKRIRGVLRRKQMQKQNVNSQLSKDRVRLNQIR